MNEIDFVGLARRSATGDIVLCHGEGATSGEAATSLAAAIETAEAAGIVIRFVDPAKPLLLFRTRPDEGARTSREPVAVEIDFFQDALYAAEPRITADRLSIWRRTDGDGAATASAWLRRAEGIVDRPLGTDTELFDAYAAGALNATYRDTTISGGSLADWIAAHMNALAVEPGMFSPWRLDLPIWEGHDVYTFR